MPGSCSAVNMSPLRSETPDLRFQQLSSVPSGAIRDLRAGEHPCQLFNTTAAIQLYYAYLRSTFSDFFLHDKMAVGKASDLRLMCYA